MAMTANGVLTARQRQALDYLNRFRKNRRRAPTVRELAGALGVGWWSAARHLEALALKGHARLAVAIRPSLARLVAARATPVPRASVSCRHCGRPALRRRFGLCWKCYEDVGVRLTYAPAPRPVGLFAGAAAANRPPAEATTARPGSPEKLAVLEARAARGELLWHRDDRCAPKRGFVDPARCDGGAA